MTSQVSVAQQLAAWAALLVGLALAGRVGVLMWPNPFGIQTPALLVYTALIYTAGIFFFLFRDYDPSYLEAYSLRQRVVRQKIPRLLAIHAVFLVFVSIVATIALWLGPSLPASWIVQGGKRRSSFGSLLILIWAILMFIQLYVSRRILSRSVEADKAKLTFPTLE